MRSELRTEMMGILEEVSNAKPGSPTALTFGSSALAVEASQLLSGIGVLSSAGRMTVEGYDYYGRLKAPRVYWLKNNWFPVAVLCVTSLVTVGTSLIMKLL